MLNHVATLVYRDQSNYQMPLTREAELDLQDGITKFKFIQLFFYA